MFSSERDVKHPCAMQCDVAQRSGSTFVAHPVLYFPPAACVALLVWMGNLSELTDAFNGPSIVDREHIQALRQSGARLQKEHGINEAVRQETSHVIR